MVLLCEFLKVTASALAIFRWENNLNSGGGIPIKQKHSLLKLFFMEYHFYKQFPSHWIHSQVTDYGNKKSCKKYRKWTFIIHRG